MDTQPNPSVWVPYTLDPVSKAELEDLSSMHKTHGILKTILKTELGEMSKVEDKSAAVLNDSISYTEFFRGKNYQNRQTKGEEEGKAKQSKTQVKTSTCQLKYTNFIISRF